MRHLLFPTSLATLALFVGCDPYPEHCETQRICNEENDVDLDDDAVATCVATARGLESTLLANNEPTCQLLVDAIRGLATCETYLNCEDFVDPERGGKCDEERDIFLQANVAATGKCQTAPEAQPND